VIDVLLVGVGEADDALAQQAWQLMADDALAQQAWQLMGH
jgi:hypothetical protein